MRQAGAGEYGQLLAADERVQPVDGGDAGLNELCGVCARGGVHGQAVYVAVSVRQYGRAAVDGLAHAVENAAEHVLAHAELQRMPEEADLRFRKVDALRGLEELYDSLVALDLEDLAAADFAVGQLKLAELVIGNALDLPDYHKRTGDLLNCLVFPDHSSSPPSAMARISSFISAMMASKVSATLS